MRQNQNAKRSRGRGRRPNNSGQNSFNRNTTFESNGPEGRLRGNAQQLFEKYTSLANDAQSSGERVLFEANSQFADHYYRIHQSILATAEQRRQNDDRRKGHNKAEAENADDKSEAKSLSNADGDANAVSSSDESSVAEQREDNVTSAELDDSASDEDSSDKAEVA